MKLLQLLKSTTRTVPDEAEDSHAQAADDGGACTHLTVWRKSLLITCNGFTVIDSSGDLVYRVENNMGCKNDVVLMDAAGRSLLSVSRRKMLGLGSEWMVYKGEDENELCSKQKLCNVDNRKNPMYNVKKNKNMFQINNNELAYVFGSSCDRTYIYAIKGSYANRSCKVSDRSGRVVAEIKRKESVAGGASFGADVFVLIVYPNFDIDFAMALVLLLDQMF